MATTLIFIRHGESRGNERHVWQGQMNWPLTERGLAQARLTAASLKDIPMDALYASDLKRTMQTAAPVSQMTGLPVIPEVGFREICGGLFEGVTYEELIRRYPVEYGCWLNDIGHATCPGGESTAALQQRLLAATDRVVAEHPGQTVCIVTHAAALRSLKCAWAGWPVGRMQDIPWPDNASVTIVRYDNGSVTVLRDNETAQLQEITTGMASGIV